MSPKQEDSSHEGKRVRAHLPHYLETNPYLHTLRVTKVQGGAVFSGRIDSTDTHAVLRQIEELLLEETGRAVEEPRSGEVAEVRSDQVQTDAQVKPSDSAAGDQDVLNWDDLIPVAPARPGGRIHVRLTKTRREQPLPAEDSWAS